MKMLTIIGVFMFSQISFAGFQDFLLDPFNKCNIITHNIDVEKGLFIQYSEYVSNKKNNEKAILILPPTGGKNILDKGYANLFCKLGYRAYILENWTGLYDDEIDFGLHQRYQTRFQKTVAYIINQIKENRIGVIGASAGAINFSVTLGEKKVIERVQAFLGVVTGGPLCKVIASTKEKGLDELREKRKKEFNIKTQAEYEKNICDNLDWNTATEKPEHLKLGLIVSTQDETVLTELQNNQVKDLKPDLLINIKASHKGTVIRSFLHHKKKIKEFFEKNL